MYTAQSTPFFFIAVIVYDLTAMSVAKTVKANAFHTSQAQLDEAAKLLADPEKQEEIGGFTWGLTILFSLVLAMEKADAEDGVNEVLWGRVGREPSGDPFNSLVQLEHERGIPRNPMINAGAIVVDDALLDHCEDPKAETLELLEELTGEALDTDETVLRREGVTGHNNLAMTYLMSSFGNINHDVHSALDVYIHQCAIQMTARQLASAIRFVANGGVDPASGRHIITPAQARRVAAIMLTCGTYDNAGEFAFNVGIPCKSGVAGGIVGVVTGELGVCVWSPPLDRSGNSLAGRIALHELSERLGLSLF